MTTTIWPCKTRDKALILKRALEFYFKTLNTRGVIHNAVIRPGTWKHQEERKVLKSWQAPKTARLWVEKRDSRLVSINLCHMETVLEEKLEHVVYKLLSVNIGACQVSCLKLLWIHTRCIKVVEWKLFCIHFGQLLSGCLYSSGMW
jgi:hypothetical protein